MFDFVNTPDALRIQIDVPSFDASNVDQFRQDFEKLCPSELPAVEIDLAKVEMIDSSAIGALLGVHRRLNGHGPIRIHNPRPPVLSLLELLRLPRASPGPSGGARSPVPALR